LDILNIDSLKPKDISEYLFGEVTVEYDKNYNHGDYRRKKVTTYTQDVIEDYQWSNSTSLPTLLNTPTLAQTMADAKALEFSTPIRTIDIVLMGERYFDAGIYDIMQVDTAMGRDEYFTGEFTGREFLGVIIGQVIGTTPNYIDLTTTVTLKILDRTATIEEYAFLLTEDDYYITTEDDFFLVGG